MLSNYPSRWKLLPADLKNKNILQFSVACLCAGRGRSPHLFVAVVMVLLLRGGALSRACAVCCGTGGGRTTRRDGRRRDGKT